MKGNAFIIQISGLVKVFVVIGEFDGCVGWSFGLGARQVHQYIDRKDPDFGVDKAVVKPCHRKLFIHVLDLALIA